MDLYSTMDIKINKKIKIEVYTHTPHTRKLEKTGLFLTVQGFRTVTKEYANWPPLNAFSLRLLETF